jgi:hypothetical protein
LAAKGEPIFDADKVEGLKVDWLAADVLRVRAQEARSFIEKKTYVASLNGRPQSIQIRYEIATRPE